MSRTAVVIPNLNGEHIIGKCLDSLLVQTKHIIVVENGSQDRSLAILKTQYPTVELIINKVNRGFAGGVNQGIQRAIEQGFDYVALFNNDAVADKNWLARLAACLDKNPGVGIAACKLLTADGKHIDSTGDFYTNWGLIYPRGRGEKVSNRYDKSIEIFSASGGASLFRISMLEETGLFDEDFFAYYEDVDLGFRAQLMGWKVRYVPGATTYHQIGATSVSVKGFATRQTTKNVPLVFIKNVPAKYIYSVGFRLSLALLTFTMRAFSRGLGLYAIKGELKALALLPKKIRERKKIQSQKAVSDEYIWSIMVHDLPPNAAALRKVRGRFWKLTGKKNG